MRTRTVISNVTMAATSGRGSWAAHVALVAFLLLGPRGAHRLAAADPKDDSFGVDVVVNLSLPPETAAAQKAYAEKFSENCKSFFEGWVGSGNVNVTVGGSPPPDGKKRYLFTVSHTLTLKLSNVKPYHFKGTVVEGSSSLGKGQEEGWEATATLRRSESYKFTDRRGGKTTNWQAADETPFEGVDKRILAGKGVVSGGKVSPEGARRSALNRVLDAMAKGKPGAGAWPDPFVSARVVRVYRDEDVWRICQTDPARGASRFSRETTALTEKQYLVAEVELVNNFLAAIEYPSASFQWNGSTPVKVNVGTAAVTRHRRMDYECRAKVLHALMPGSSVRVICPVKVELSMEVRDAPARGEDLVPHLSGSGHRLDFPNRDQAWLDQRIAALKHVDVAVRGAAAEALRDTPVPEAGKALLATLQDTDEGVRWKAFGALVPLGLPETAPYAVQRLRDERVAVDALYAIGLPAFDAIATGLTDTDVVIRRTCAKLLADWPPKNAVDPLVKALQDPVPDVRAQAATALGELGDPRALKPLEKAIKDSDASVAHAAAMATAALTRKP